MAWMRTLAGLVHPARDLIEAFGPDIDSNRPHLGAARLALGVRDLRDLVALQELATGLEPRAARTRWDALIDGLNRVPRPLITLGALAFFVLAPLDPGRFAQIARAYELMPDGFWALLSVIVAFYFGGRMQLKRQDLAVRDGALAIAREMVALQRAARERDDSARAQLPRADAPFEPTPHPNRVIEAWKRRRELAASG
jgi:hypothetical protein